MAPVSLPTGGDDRGPFSLADRGLVNDLLCAAGLESIRIEPVEERLRVGDDADDVLGFYRDHPQAKAAMAAAPAQAVQHVLGAIRGALLPHESPEGVFLASAGWLVSARPRPGSATTFQ